MYDFSHWSKVIIKKKAAVNAFKKPTQNDRGK